MKRLLALVLVTIVVLGGSTAAARWRPRAGLTWQWQLTGKIDKSVRAKVFDVDLFEVPRSVVSALHDKGRKVICYMSAGSFEKWRPDAGDFPSSVKGKPLEGWAGERWLDIRKLKVLKPIMRDRLDKCRNKGFDGVEFDNVDGYTNESGFPLKSWHQLRYNRWLAAAAHRRGLAAGLKNDLGQVRQLEPGFDFAVNEQCFQYKECRVLRRFIHADKPVFHVEYELRRSRFCDRAKPLGFSSMRKRYALGTWRRVCRS